MSSAIASATRASSGAKLGECCVVAARIALEDGDLPRAERMIEKARAESSSARVFAEVALLEALLARAQGSPFAGAAARALGAEVVRRGRTPSALDVPADSSLPVTQVLA